MMIKAIETEYNGYRFRSRLEARWAVFFDAAGIEYQYEPEGYDLGDGIWYLPDFYLPKMKIWVEVKGQEPTDEEELKCEKLSMGTDKPVLLVGQIPEFYGLNDPNIINGDRYFGYHFEPYMNPITGEILPGTDHPYFFCQCGFCGKLGCEFDGRSERISCCYENTGHKNYNTATPLLFNAYEKAKSARFGR